MVKQTNRLGILSFESLIAGLWDELGPYIVDEIPCETPFNVEYKRLSEFRSNAPILVPSGEYGRPVKAVLFVLSDHIDQQQAESILYRRALHTSDSSTVYKKADETDKKSILIEKLVGFHDVSVVLYTSMPANMGALDGPNYLSYFAINSIIDVAGESKMDGLRYLENNINSGVITVNTPQYVDAVLKETDTKTLSEAITKLDRMRPDNLARKKDLESFEMEFSKLSDLINQYGIENSRSLNHETPEMLRLSIMEHREEFLAKVHEGWKLGQKVALRMLLSIQEQLQILKASLKEAYRSKNRLRLVRIKADISYNEFKENLVRHLMDTIVWQILQGQLYISRRLYLGVEGSKMLKDTNIESVLSVADRINETPGDFALIADLSGYIQSGDLLCKIGRQIVLVEVKDGDRNHEIVEILGEIQAGEIDLIEATSKYKLSEKDLKQLERQAKQIAVMENISNIVNTDKGFEHGTNNPIEIITPAESTPRFTNDLYEVRKQLDNRNLWGYTVVNECLHIGLYKGPFKIVGAKLLKAIGDTNSQNTVLINYKTVIRSLNKPFFLLPFEREYIFNILFGRMDLYFLLDLDAFISIASDFGMKARWATERETNKERAKGNKELFILNGRGIVVALANEAEFKQELFIAAGAIHKIVYEHINPAYVMYSFKYFLKPTSENSDDNVSGKQ
ncbi:MAG: hypothetical protein EOP04_00570 [Proteobacteria bacterium]|nr:MAG: hypothetical protein EOP04_00570 [Pseudomonadota bacterium]